MSDMWHGAPMRTAVLSLVAGLLAGCSVPPSHASSKGPPELTTSEAFIDSFYSFDPVRLQDALANAPASAPVILYYQGWAEGGNYRIMQRRPCHLEKAGEVRCDITVEDDLIAALGTGYDVTDSFHLAFKDGRIVKVHTTSNDPPQMSEAFKWLRGKHPEIWDGPCRDFFAGGKTPQDCVRAVVGGFRGFRMRGNR